MTDRQLLRLAAVAAILGGVLRLGTALVAWNPDSVWLEALALVIDLSCLFGLLGLYLPHRGRLGLAGAAAFVVAASGIASIVGPDTTAFGIDTYQAGVMTLSLGLSLLASLMLRRRAGASTAAWLWIASTVAGILGVVTGQAQTGVFVGGVLFGLAFVAGGVQEIRRRRPAHDAVAHRRIKVGMPSVSVIHAVVPTNPYPPNQPKRCCAP